MPPKVISNAGIGLPARAVPPRRRGATPNPMRTGIRGRSPHGCAQKAEPASNEWFVGALVFSGKTFAAALLALFVSFWLGLDEPYWALLTTFVVAQPDSGLVLAKGFYRLLGTAVGILVTIALVFAFAQYGEIFIASLAVWIGLCSFAARGTRNFAAYGFQLAGYTVAIVGLPAALNPDAAYTLVVARFTEITLGIACAGLLSRLVFPRELAPKLIALAHDLFRRVDHFAKKAMDPAIRREQLTSERGELAKTFGAVESMRASTFFESADARLIDGPLRNALQAAVGLYAAAEQAAARPGPFHGASATPDSSIANTYQSPQGHLEILSRLLQAADAQAITHARGRLGEAQNALDNCKNVSTRAKTVLWSDPAAAVLTGVRSALAVVITAAFWFATAWPSGPIAVIVAGVVCTLIAPMEQAQKITLALGATILGAAIPVFATQIYLLPYASDFLSMAVALAPLLLTCGFVIAQPGIGPLGLLSAVYLAVASHIDNNNPQTYDALAFFNTSLAILFGIGVALVLFATFFPEAPRWVGRRLLRQLRVRLGRLAAGMKLTLPAFEFALSEQLAATLANVKDDEVIARDCLHGGAIALSSGRAIERLRAVNVAGHLSPAMTADVTKLLGGVSRTYLKPSWARVTTDAWEARLIARRALTKARAVDSSQAKDALLEVALGCETLRTDLLKMHMFIPEQSHVPRS
jgi:uncharacterized membrane protein YccC